LVPGAEQVIVEPLRKQSAEAVETAQNSIAPAAMTAPMRMPMTTPQRRNTAVTRDDCPAPITPTPNFQPTKPAGF
jgi:hypothetical protein